MRDTVEMVINEPFVLKLVQTAQSAGQAILEHYRNNFTVHTKPDMSPVTTADEAAEEIILTALTEIAPDIPVIAEEAASKGTIVETSERFFLVDPLDGTKEFIQKRDEFTVNIALIESKKPRLGVVYAPAINQLYCTLTPEHAIEMTLEPNQSIVNFNNYKKIQTRRASEDGITVAVSRSHMNEETKRFLDPFSIKSTLCAGSSLKFCLVACGSADLYPRLGRTMEWDTAAGHAILTAAGGIVLTDKGEPFLYGKHESDYANPGFVAWGQPPTHPPLHLNQ